MGGVLLSCPFIARDPLQLVFLRASEDINLLLQLDNGGSLFLIGGSQAPNLEDEGIV